jgi:hypothetical protein
MKLIQLCVMLLTSTIVFADTIGAIPGQAWIHRQPNNTAPIITQPFGNGYITNQVGRAPIITQPFGNGTISNQVGYPPVICQPFGNGISCK